MITLFYLWQDHLIDGPGLATAGGGQGIGKDSELRERLKANLKNKVSCKNTILKSGQNRTLHLVIIVIITSSPTSNKLVGEN